MLDPQDAAAIAARYELGRDSELVGPVARGEVGQVWRLNTAQGTWAVKEPFERPSRDEAQDDAAFQHKARAGGVPMPGVVCTGSGEVLCELPSATVRVYEWVELMERDARLDPATVARVVATLHCVDYVGRNGVDPWYTDPVGEDSWDDLVRRLDAAGAPFVGLLSEQRDELVALQQLLEKPVALQTCHRDLFADNVLRTPSGGLCVIDWENAGLAEPAQELGLVLFEYSCGEMGRARALYDAYRNAGGPGRIDRPGNFTMIVCQLAHIGETACKRWLDPARRADRAHNEAWAMEFLTQPLTRRMIDDFVDTLST
ncbi:MAG TPA: aminoglycoside phosphotransferase family protein [Ilumatobacteraceae bacterium]|nr:aminoglycoside phosphotransferase family protein [Ilumatobacteraceae bacterium]